MKKSEVKLFIAWIGIVTLSFFFIVGIGKFIKQDESVSKTAGLFTLATPVPTKISPTFSPTVSASPIPTGTSAPTITPPLKRQPACPRVVQAAGGVCIPTH